MIASLTGILSHKSPQYLIVEIQGVGYQVYTSLQSFCGLPDTGARVTLHTYTRLSEETLRLYGFLTSEERELFTLLLGVSGIGPRNALGVLSGLSVRDLVAAVQAEDVDRLKAVPGIGAKTAGRLVLELKDKLPQVREAGAPAGTATASGFEQQTVFRDTLSALLNLGYARQAAEAAIKKVAERDGYRGTDGQAGPSVETLIRLTLRELSTL